MTISEFIKACGDDQIQFQVLHDCVSGARSTKRGCKITFGTEAIQAADLLGEWRNVGVVVWIPKDRYDAVRKEMQSLRAEKRNDLIKNLVDAFLAWPLPESVCSDPCATERGYPHRSGTNLLDAAQARQMFEYVLAKCGHLQLSDRAEKPEQ